MIHSCVFLFSDSCSWVPCLSWTVKLSAVHQKNPSAPTNYLWFQHFYVFEPVPIDFDIHLFTPRTTEGLMCNYYRRFKHSLMQQKEKKHALRAWVWKQNEDVYIFLVLPKYHFFSFTIVLQKLQKIVTCFPEDKMSRRQIKLNSPWSSNSNSKLLKHFLGRL